MPDLHEYKELESRYLMPTYARSDVAVVSGSGATFTDADGCRYIDFGSGIGVNCLGSADKEWAQAVGAQAATLAHCSNLYYNPVQIAFARELCQATGFSKAFLCNSGAEANEALIKLARKYACDTYGDSRPTIVALDNSFHGRTVTTLSATGQADFHRFFGPFTEGFRFTPANDIASMEKALSGDVCAVLLEAIQGEGGVLPLDAQFVQKTAELAKSRGILLLFDEVQTGVGRTGRFFGFEHFGVRADAVSLAKALGGGLPIGALLCSEALGGVLSAGTHGSTFGGNPVACAGGRVVLSRVAKPEFLSAVAEKGEYIAGRLRKMPGVKNIRGMGLMIGFEIEGVSAKAAAAQLLSRGLVILTAKTALRMLPPLVITRGEIDEGLAILEEDIAQGM
ncbi:MAG: acetylornithine/succinylornithine family transaminase [Clostridia bacterium]|nr:acetylornithine/succinylornithine family transaminase [Clostridia bacterium]